MLSNLDIEKEFTLEEYENVLCRVAILLKRRLYRRKDRNRDYSDMYSNYVLTISAPVKKYMFGTANNILVQSQDNPKTILELLVKQDVFPFPVESLYMLIVTLDAYGTDMTGYRWVTAIPSPLGAIEPECEEFKAALC